MTNLVKQFLVGDFVHLFTDRAVKDDGHLVPITFIHMAVQSIVACVQLSTNKPWNVSERVIERRTETYRQRKYIIKVELM